jgi:hypothetical protein
VPETTRSKASVRCAASILSTVTRES